MCKNENNNLGIECSCCCFGSVLYLISLHSIRDAVTFINSIEVNKLSRLLSRILQKLHLKVWIHSLVSSKLGSVVCSRITPPWNTSVYTEILVLWLVILLIICWLVVLFVISLRTDFINITESFNFMQHVSGATHTGDHTLDLVFSLGLNVSYTWCEDLLISNHKCIFFDTSENIESFCVKKKKKNCAPASLPRTHRSCFTRTSRMIFM